jgi:hypothetical protein
MGVVQGSIPCKSIFFAFWAALRLLLVTEPWSSMGAGARGYRGPTDTPTWTPTR